MERVLLHVQLLFLIGAELQIYYRTTELKAILVQRAYELRT